MTNDAQKYEKIFSGTKEVAENLKIDAASLQPWIDAHVEGARRLKALNSLKAANQIQLIKQSKRGEKRCFYPLFILP